MGNTKKLEKTEIKDSDAAGKGLNNVVKARI